MKKYICWSFPWAWTRSASLLPPSSFHTFWYSIRKKKSGSHVPPSPLFFKFLPHIPFLFVCVGGIAVMNNTTQATWMYLRRFCNRDTYLYISSSHPYKWKGLAGKLPAINIIWIFVRREKRWKWHCITLFCGFSLSCLPALGEPACESNAQSWK